MIKIIFIIFSLAIGAHALSHDECNKLAKEINVLDNEIDSIDLLLNARKRTYYHAVKINDECRLR
ncbi:hypothetical protein JHD46_01725 [Sulfurimonas sp. SAG-AH-194-C20]|nr:hypothetical protein [Sulfurimonas sp. SAG-AH-194-C20]MDF1878353.1 hypothetical protein [Sulfurimonas sp. SAG-AH-194-C20]